MTNHSLRWGEKRGEKENCEKGGTGGMREKKKRDFGAQSCRVSQSVWFKYLSTFPEGEYSGHSWSSIMPDIHSHCQRRQTDWAVLRLIPAVVQPTEINRQPSSDAPQIVSYSTHHTGLFIASPILIHFHCYKIIIPPAALETYTTSQFRLLL